MKRGLFFISLLILLAAMSAYADYYVTVDGQDVETAQVEVGATVTIGIWSTDANLVPEPTGNTQYGLYHSMNAVSWNGDFSGYFGTLSNLVYQPAAGPSAWGWTNAAPYNSIASIGWSVENPSGVSAGKWFELTFSASEQGTVNVGIVHGSYTQTYDYVTLTVVPATSGTDSVLIAQWEGDFAAVEDVNKITDLHDQTVNGYDMHILQYWDPDDTGDYRPILIPDALNGHDVIQFEGDQFMKYWDPANENDENWVDAQNYTWFMMARDIYPELPQTTGSFVQQALLVNAYRDYALEVEGDQYSYLGWGNTLFYGNYNGTIYKRTFANTEEYTFGLAQEYAQVWGIPAQETQSEWRVIVGVWDAPDAESVLVDGDIDTYGNYAKGSDAPPYYEDEPSTSYLSGHFGTYLGSAYEWSTIPRYTGQVAELRIYRGAMNVSEIIDEVRDLRIKYGFETATACTDFDDVVLTAQNWLNAVRVIWEDDMSVDPVADGDWAVRGTANNYSMSGGKMVLGSGGWSTLVDTQPGLRFDCKTDITVDWRSTQNLTSAGGAEGTAMYVNVGDPDNLPFGNLLFEVRRDSSTSQQVRIWDSGDSTLLHTFSGFGTGMIHMEFTVDVQALTLTVHTVSDGSVTDSAVIPFGLNGVYAGYPYVTITTLNEPGEIDYLLIEATPDSVHEADRNGDCEVDFEDFADLASTYDPPCN